METPNESQEPVVFGWREFVYLPEWTKRSVRAKVDTGARTSAIDVQHIEELPNDRVRFLIRTRRDPSSKPVTVETDVVRRTHVRSSSGHIDHRIFVATIIRIGPVERRVEISLVDRQDLKCRMLLGRSALEPDVLVNPAVRYLHGRQKKSRSRSRSANEGTS